LGTAPSSSSTAGVPKPIASPIAPTSASAPPLLTSPISNG
jgi:hypothetical protein